MADYNPIDAALDKALGDAMKAVPDGNAVVVEVKQKDEGGGWFMLSPEREKELARLYGERPLVSGGGIVSPTIYPPKGGR